MAEIVAEGPTAARLTVDGMQSRTTFVVPFADRVELLPWGRNVELWRRDRTRTLDVTDFSGAYRWNRNGQVDGLYFKVD